MKKIGTNWKLELTALAIVVVGIASVAALLGLLAGI